MLAFGFSWTVAGIGALFGVDAQSGLAYMGMAALVMLGPAIAAIVQHRLIDRSPWADLGLHPERIKWKPLLWTVLLGVSIVPTFFLVVALCGELLGLSLFGHVAITGERFGEAIQAMMADFGTPTSSGAVEMLAGLPGALILVVLLISAVFSACSFNLPFMLGEELGWRGYLYQATTGWSTTRRVLFTGVVWGFWHAPLILMGHNYPGWPLLGVLLMVVFCVLLAVIFDWCRTRVASVWGPCVLHGLINGTAGATALFAWGGHPLVGTIVGVAGMVAIALLSLLVLAIDEPYRNALLSGNPMDPR